ncbi:uncharacterized protein CC84DRAFT_1191111 [Paraphaeosphaeria sporulosa]|uniref:Aminoglycoside phosphotransferase domain-containing protein n=1 Tax=Paraphaeosphaeria sporulosa TaxID=1460663 RepID=A0A177BXR9_9PLEO|nr:uncharacterized protein CC84DRAFT_1191111 [Paraphaeosphaeria sporulosa]OAF99750.1 hypothetical protein CC84DRAFT_1191111 [Paraphaeosphaeria sporulosa]
MHLPPLDVAVYPVVAMNHGRHISRSARAGSAVSSISSSSSASSPTCAPSADFSGIQRAIQSVFRSSKITVRKAERLPGRLHQVYRAQLADGSIFVLKCPPHVSSRALRHEKHGLETELKTLRYLREYRQGQLPVPEVYQYQEHGGVLGSPFLLMSFVQGRKLAEMLTYLSAHERTTIDRTLGAYMRIITMLNAQQFGMTHTVFANKGSGSWREAFRALLESALRDCEDMLITLPYDSIRYYVEQHLHTLDEVQTPCMVAMDMCDPQSVLVDEQTKKVTGLVGFSNVIWGDPLMNEAIATGSDAFFEGYGERPPRSPGLHARQLIYAIYRATVQIASLNHRPQPRVNDTDARRSMTFAVNRLAALK